MVGVVLGRYTFQANEQRAIKEVRRRRRYVHPSQDERPAEDEQHVIGVRVELPLDEAAAGGRLAQDV